MKTFPALLLAQVLTQGALREASKEKEDRDEG